MVLEALDHPFSRKNGDSYALLDGKALGIFEQIRKYHALCMPLLRVLANSYSNLWATQNHISSVE